MDEPGLTLLSSLVAATARAVVAAGLIEAFGHVSARLGDGEGGGVLITPTTPLAAVRPEDIVRVDASGAVHPPGAPAPLEVALHRSIYMARPDVNAICRGHGPAMVAWGTRGAPLPLRHGLGLLAGAHVRVHADLQLVTDHEAGDAVAATLGQDACVLLLGNGGLAAGRDLLEAATRLWFLEERARVALTAAPEPTSAQDPDDGEWRRRGRHSAAELDRAMTWFASTHLNDQRPTHQPEESA
jgi:HCOMODA/2-hydroxy-3-carboxy-muconic semialdehyde decarboxylase